VEPVLTVRQPWASAIFVAGKDVENRPKRTHYRGRLWIDAGLKSDQGAIEWAAKNKVWVPQEPFEHGVILGSVELVDCVEESWSPWAVDGNYYWINPRVLRYPVAQRGQLGFACGDRRQQERPRRRNVILAATDALIVAGVLSLKSCEALGQNPHWRRKGGEPHR